MNRVILNPDNPFAYDVVTTPTCAIHWQREANYYAFERMRAADERDRSAREGDRMRAAAMADDVRAYQVLEAEATRRARQMRESAR